MSRDVGESGSGRAASTDVSPENNQYATLANAVADGLFQIDADGSLVATNDAFLDAVDCTREELLGEPLDQAFPLSDAERLSAARRGLVGSDSDTVTLPASLPTTDGGDRSCEIRLRLVEGTNGGAAGSVRVIEEVTKAVGDPAKTYEDALGRTQKELHAETEKFRSLVDAVEEYAIFMLNPEGQITSWNQGAERIKGYDAEEILGEHFSLFYTDEDQAEGIPANNLEAAAQTGSVEDAGWRVREDGTRFWANVTITPVRDDDGTLMGYAKVTRDMTERREQEKALRRERDLVTQILEVNPIGIAVLDDSGAITRLNEAGVEVLGVDSREINDHELDEWNILDEEGTRVPPSEWPQSRTLRTGEAVFDWRCEVEGQDGTRRWISANAVPLYDEDRDSNQVILTAHDITPLKRREAQLRRERDLTERILETTPIGIAVLAAEDEVEHVNERGQEILGIDTATPDIAFSDRGQLLDEAGSPIPNEERPFVRAFSTGEQVTDWQCQYDHPDGGLRWLSVNASPVYEDGEVERVVTVGDDITQHKEQARQLERQRDDLASELDEMFRRIDDAFYAVDDQFRFTYVNERAEDLLQHEGATLLGRSVWEVFPEATETPAWESFHQALESQEPTSYEVYFEPLGFWVEASVYPSETGLSVYFRDVTERKERERELETYETIVKTVDDGVYVCDEEFRFTMVNDAYVDMTGYDREQLIGTHVSLVVDEDVSAESAERLQEIAADETSSAAIEADIHRADGSRLRAESKFTAIPFDDTDHPRKVGVVRDVTERKERERALEESRNRYRTLVENFPNGAVALVDEDLRYTTVGGTPITGPNATVAGLEGSLLDEILPPDLADVLVPRYASALDGERSAFEQEIGGRIYQFWTLPVRNDSGDVFAALGMSQDITERKQRERELQTRVSQQEAVTDLGQQALSERDLDALFDEVADCVADVLDADYCKVLELLPGGGEVLLRSGVGWRDGLVGDATVGTGLDSQAGYTLRSEEPIVVEDLATESRFSGPELLTSHDVSSGVSTIIGTADDPWGVLGVHTTDEREFSEHDVNFVQSVATILATAIERADREQELELYETIVETVDDGVYALDPDGDFVLVNDAYCELSGYDREELLGRPGKMVSNDQIDETAAHLTTEINAGERDAAVLEVELQTADGGSISVETRFGPYPYDEERYGRTGVTRDITDRLERERALKRQREELAVLNRLNEVVQETTHAIVESSSREEIERLVCERLADSESYQFAWIGEVDRTSGTVALRTEAGVTGYLDDMVLAVDPEDGDDGPTARAIRTREPQVIRDAMADFDYEPWQSRATEYGFRSSAAIPIVHEDILYGVLNVYSARPGAFDGYERTLLARLGNVVGHTINALERKEALMSDQVQEVDLVRTDVVSLVDDSVPTDGTIAFERTVLVGEDTYLQYGTADEEAMALLEGLVDTLPFWEELTVLDERFGQVSFELRLSEPPAISTMATYGGRIRSATIEDGDFQLYVELPPAADVRAVLEALQAEYPGMELVAQRRTARDAWSVRRIDDVLEEQLTDRQRAALQAAYYAGYFDTPRKRSGEAVAESLGITAPTLHQHLRKGQRKLLSAMFNEPEKK